MKTIPLREKFNGSEYDCERIVTGAGDLTSEAEEGGLVMGEAFLAAQDEAERVFIKALDEATCPRWAALHPEAARRPSPGASVP